MGNSDNFRSLVNQEMLLSPEASFDLIADKLRPVVAGLLDTEAGSIIDATALTKFNWATAEGRELRDKLNIMVSQATDGFSRGGPGFFGFINRATTFEEMVLGVVRFEKFLREPTNHPSVVNDESFN